MGQENCPSTTTVSATGAQRDGDDYGQLRMDRPGQHTYSVDPVEFTLHWHQSGGEVRVQTTNGCPWTAASAESWLGVPATSTSGSGSVAVGQNVSVTQEGCWFAIGERDKAFPRDGGKAFLLVFGTPMSTSCNVGCPWTATSDVPWIQMLGTGAGWATTGCGTWWRPIPGLAHASDESPRRVTRW